MAESFLVITKKEGKSNLHLCISGENVIIKMEISNQRCRKHQCSDCDTVKEWYHPFSFELEGMQPRPMVPWQLCFWILWSFVYALWSIGVKLHSPELYYAPAQMVQKI